MMWIIKFKAKPALPLPFTHKAFPVGCSQLLAEIIQLLGEVTHQIGWLYCVFNPLVLQ